VPRSGTVVGCASIRDRGRVCFDQGPWYGVPRSGSVKTLRQPPPTTDRFNNTTPPLYAFMHAACVWLPVCPVCPDRPPQPAEANCGALHGTGEWCVLPWRGVARRALQSWRMVCAAVARRGVACFTELANGVCCRGAAWRGVLYRVGEWCVLSWRGALWRSVLWCSAARRFNTHLALPCLASTATTPPCIVVAVCCVQQYLTAATQCCASHY
jgi:hypothetical protein